MTSSKEGSIAAAGLVYEQRGESSAKIDGDQVANIIGKVNDLAGKVEHVATIGGQAMTAVDAVKAAVNVAAADASAAKTDASTAKTDASAAKDKATGLSAKVDSNSELLTDARKKVDTFDDKIDNKIAKLSTDQLQKLESVKNDTVKFQDEFRKSLADLGLSAAEIKAVEAKTKGLSTEQIIGLLAAAGAGGVIGKTGKSRAQPDVDMLKSKVAELDHVTVKKTS